MANGFAPNLLLQLAAIFNGQAPAKKITSPGYLNMLLRQGTPNVVSTAKGDASGHVRDVKFYFRKPGTKGTSATVDNCEVDAKPARFEATVPSTLYRKRTLLFEDDQIKQYNTEASNIVKPAINGPGQIMPLSADNFQGMLKEVYDTIIEEMRGLVADINSDLLAAQAVAFGVNAVTGSNAVVPINFPLGLVNPLNQGMTKIISDARVNEFDLANAFIVGSGLIDNYMVQHLFGAKSADSSGLNTAMLQAAKNYFYDIDAASAWGNNQLGIFDTNAVQFLEVNRYVGAFAGVRGKSIFFNAPLPIADSLGNADISKLNFDWQIWYSDCPQTIEIDGTPTAVGRGWIVTIGKSFHQVNLPSNLYPTGDRLEGNNGTIRYEATNLCVDCPTEESGSGSGS